MDIQEFCNWSCYDPLQDDINSIPDQKGCYLIVSRTVDYLPLQMRELDFNVFDEKPIIYCGITNKSLRHRFSTHLNGTARNSTLRKSLGVMFGYKRYYYQDCRYRFIDGHEAILSDWMKANLLFYYLETDNTEETEAKLINLLSPPLNIQGNYSEINFAFRENLKTQRKQPPDVEGN